MNITIIDYKIGNIKSVHNALKHLGAKPLIAKNPSEVKVGKIIIPGVGSFGKGMINIKPFIPKIEEALNSHLPLLGICLGQQMFFEESEESPGEKGLGLMKGRNTKIGTRMKLPHIGWNRIEISEKDCPLFRDIENGYAYFVHSYHAIPEEDVVVATTDYGCKITASVWKNNVYGTQFHPEKSGTFGLRILKNFLEI